MDFSSVLHDPTAYGTDVNQTKNNVKVRKRAKKLRQECEKQHEMILQAQKFCYELAKLYWKQIKIRTKVDWRLRRLPFSLPLLNIELQKNLHDHFQVISELEPEYAGYEISLLYQKLLPKSYREKVGIYYTPTHVVERMLDDASKLNVNLQTAHVIDPSSGGAAYLAPLCRRMINKKLKNPNDVRKDIEKRLVGIEIDPFAAWFSQFLVDCVLADLAPSKVRPKNIVTNANSLQCPKRLLNKFDYVIGNPPYGITNLSKSLAEEYSDVLSGKANLYQLFFKLGFELAKESGVVHFVTPTGFISGNYFKSLREYIENISSPVFFQFFDSRTSIFKGVQQEIVISAFQKGGEDTHPLSMTLLESQSKQSIINQYVTEATSFRKGLWVLPKSRAEHRAAKLFARSPHNLESIGFTVKTGYLVPHRSGDLLGNKKYKKSFPVLWAESIQHECFDPESAYRKGRDRWYTPETKTGLYNEEAILVKRTSSKEQRRRIHSAKVSRSFLSKYKRFVAENHVNVVTATKEACVSLFTLEKLMRSDIFDDLFRCGSGTVTVSAAELRRIPLPSRKGLLLFRDYVGRSNDIELINEGALLAYKEFD